MPATPPVGHAATPASRRRRPRLWEKMGWAGRECVMSARCGVR